jgi:hypothetical protein
MSVAGWIKSMLYCSKTILLMPMINILWEVS